MTVYIRPSWILFPKHTAKNIPSILAVVSLSFPLSFSSAFHKARIVFCGDENHKIEKETHWDTARQGQHKPGFNFYHCYKYALASSLRHLISLPWLFTCEMWILILLSWKCCAEQSCFLLCTGNNNHSDIQSRRNSLSFPFHLPGSFPSPPSLERLACIDFHKRNITRIYTLPGNWNAIVPAYHHLKTH